jgi:hypothetical protein
VAIFRRVFFLWPAVAARGGVAVAEFLVVGEVAGVQSHRRGGEQSLMEGFMEKLL